jgi:hypothetical protein
LKAGVTSIWESQGKCRNDAQAKFEELSLSSEVGRMAFYVDRLAYIKGRGN